MAAAQACKTARGDECTIRTNPPHVGGRGGAGLGAGGSLSDACETCSQHKTMSREQLQNAGLKGCNKDGKFNLKIPFYSCLL